MNSILKYSSYLFHPIFIPIIGGCLFYYNSVKYHSENLIVNRLIQLFILTVIIPILFFRVLKKMGFISSIMVEEVKERKALYFIGVILNLYIGLKVFNNHSEIEMRYFFFGITACSISLFILSLLKFKASLHMAAISGLTVFVIGLSLHFQVSLISLISLLLFLNGLIATSRLHLKAHSVIELIIGSVLGASTQFMMLVYWL